MPPRLRDFHIQARLNVVSTGVRGENYREASPWGLPPAIPLSPSREPFGFPRHSPPDSAQGKLRDWDSLGGTVQVRASGMLRLPWHPTGQGGGKTPSGTQGPVALRQGMVKNHRTPAPIPLAEEPSMRRLLPLIAVLAFALAACGAQDEAELDFGERAKSTTALAKGMRASGKPNFSAA